MYSTVTTYEHETNHTEDCTDVYVSEISKLDKLPYIKGYKGTLTLNNGDKYDLHLMNAELDNNVQVEYASLDTACIYDVQCGFSLPEDLLSLFKTGSPDFDLKFKEYLKECLLSESDDKMDLIVTIISEQNKEKSEYMIPSNTGKCTILRSFLNVIFAISAACENSTYDPRVLIEELDKIPHGKLCVKEEST